MAGRGGAPRAGRGRSAPVLGDLVIAASEAPLTRGCFVRQEGVEGGGCRARAHSNGPLTRRTGTAAKHHSEGAVAKILPVIMCGGSGTRVWPESRESLPKQFIPLIGDRSTFQSIVGVVGDGEVFERPVVITNFDYRFRVAEQLKEIGAEAAILLEPERRDSAAAVGAAAAWAAARDPNAIVAVLAADHVFKDEKGFARLCAEAGKAAEAGEIVTFGVKPDHPATGYGYIQPGEPLAADPKIRRVERFVEKPSEEQGADLHRERLSVEFGKFRLPGRRDAGRAQGVRADDRRGDRRSRGSRQDGSRLPRSRSRRVHPGAAHLDRLCGDGAYEPRRGARGGRGLVGRRAMVDGVAAEPTRRERQQPARPGGRDRLVEHAGPLGRAFGRRDRTGQRDRGGDRRRGAGRAPVAVGQGQGSRCAAEGGESAGGDAAPPHVPPLGLLPEHRPGSALPGQANCRAGPAAVCRCKGTTIAPSTGSSCVGPRK